MCQGKIFGRPINKLEDHRTVRRHDKVVADESKAAQERTLSDSESDSETDTVMKMNTVAQKHLASYYPPMYQGPMTQDVKKKITKWDKEIEEELNKYSVFKEGVSSDVMIKIRVSYIAYHYLEHK